MEYVILTLLIVVIVLLLIMLLRKKDDTALKLTEIDRNMVKELGDFSHNINEDFEPLLQKEIFGKNKSKSFCSSFLDVSKNTLELTNYDNDLTYYNKVEAKRKSTRKIISEYKNEFDNTKNFCKNSMSFTEIFDDLSSHFSILINNN